MGGAEPRELAGGPFRIGDWLVEPPLNRLSKGDTTIQLELKVMDVLVCLAEEAGEVVARQQIVDRVWATEFISDNTLTHAITELRNALGDDARNPTFIETIHRRGYRLIAPVGPVVADEQGESKVARFPTPERVPPAAEDRSPYPGLAAFTEADAEFFFGREDEVARMWRKLTSRRLLALIGPSGVGKSSFLRAGVIPAKPEGWGVLVCQPSEAPFAALARALVPEFGGDDEAISRLVHLTEPEESVAMVSRWRQQHDQALLVIDQFEELFTLNPIEVQARFAALLRLLVDQADINVLLSMRDDFLHRCHDLDALGPIFDSLTPVKAPAGEELRRALVSPAKRRGFAFEDDDLPGEMVVDVEGERGALPLLAFAVARLWDKRDQDSNLMTRQAYADIGGVGGALARHAEETLKSVGDNRMPVVRELFRNLVTAQGTRAVRLVDDLMSVFPDDRSDDAAEVLGRLIDARLLTSFEEEGLEDAASHHRVEVVHESLLSSWPRLVGWQTQDADSARLRDELRQAAKAWEEHDRPVDWLWTGAQYREYASWRERYPGGLSAVEEDFATGMTAHAKRRKRRRRIAAAALVAVLLGCVAVLGALWQRSNTEARRAEAANLMSVAQLELEPYPSAAVAYATASLELADRPEARILALEALWKGPTAFVVDESRSTLINFTPDGQWLVQMRNEPEYCIHVIGADGTNHHLDTLYERDFGLWMDSESGLFSTHGWGAPSPWALWSAPEKKLLAETHDHNPDPANTEILANDEGRRRMLLEVFEDGRAFVDALGFDGSTKRLGEIPFDLRSATRCEYAPGGEWFAVANGQGVNVIEIGDHDLSEPRLLEQINCLPVAVACDPLGRFVAVGCENGFISLLYRDDEVPRREIQGPTGTTGLRFSKDGTLLETIKTENDEVETWVWSLKNDEPALQGHVRLGKSRGWPWLDWELDSVDNQIVSVLNPDGEIRLWPLRAPADAEPVIMRRGEKGSTWFRAIPPQGKWVATSGSHGLKFWPLARTYPIVIRQYQELVWKLLFDPKGRWLAMCSNAGSGTVRLWQLDGAAMSSARTVYETAAQVYAIDTSGDGEKILVAEHDQTVRLLSLNGEAPVYLQGFSGLTPIRASLSADGRFVAVSSRDQGTADVTGVIRVVNVASKEEVKLFHPDGKSGVSRIRFTEDGHLLSGNNKGLLRWDIETGDSKVLFDGPVGHFAMSSDNTRVLLTKTEGLLISGGSPVVLDLATGSTTQLASRGDNVTAVAMDAGGTIVVTGDADGIIRVGPITGEEPHLLLGSAGEVIGLAVDPKGRWIASFSGTELRLWPMPDLSKPPLHALPREELIAKLKTLTNLRVVRDRESASGWKLEVGPFPGWETVPTW